MTPEILRQNAAAMLAFSDGKPVESKLIVAGENAKWICYNEGLGEAPSFNCKDFEYRPKPEPKVRQWNCANDIPVGPCYLRAIDSAGLSWTQILSAGTGGIQVAGDGGMHFVSYATLESYRHSTDRINWKPCTVEEP